MTAPDTRSTSYARENEHRRSGLEKTKRLFRTENNGTTLSKVHVVLLATLFLSLCSSVSLLRGCTSQFSGYYHTCAIFDDNKVKCWGYNKGGQLGYGDITTRGMGAGQMGSYLDYIDLTGDIVTTAMGANHTCVIFDDFTASCWGDNSDGQIGLGDVGSRGSGPGEMGTYLEGIDVGSGLSVDIIVAKFLHTCVRTTLGRVKCFGLNSDGQLGYGDIQSRGNDAGEMGDYLPFVETGSTCMIMDSVSAGGRYACVLCSTGDIKCWGFNNFGQLGYGDRNDRGDQVAEMGDYLPAIDLGTGFVATGFHEGHNHNCAILQDGSVKCWGINFRGHLGLGDNNDRGDEPGEMGDYLPTVELGTGRTALSMEASIEEQKH